MNKIKELHLFARIIEFYKDEKNKKLFEEWKEQKDNKKQKHRTP